MCTTHGWCRQNYAVLQRSCITIETHFPRCPDAISVRPWTTQAAHRRYSPVRLPSHRSPGRGGGGPPLSRRGAARDKQCAPGGIYRAGNRRRASFEAANELASAATARPPVAAVLGATTAGPWSAEADPRVVVARARWLSRSQPAHQNEYKPTPRRGDPPGPPAADRVPAQTTARAVGPAGASMHAAGRRRSAGSRAAESPNMRRARASETRSATTPVYAITGPIYVVKKRCSI